jgi:long-chain acyl-CoA synthetase
MQSVWFNSYPPGISKTIDPDQFASLNGMFDHVCKTYADSPAFTNLGNTISYAEALQQSFAFASFLQNQLHFTKGERFAIFMPNTIQYPIAIMGILRAGGIFVNVNTLIKEGEFIRQMNDSQVSGIIVAENLASFVANALDSTQIKHIIVAKFSDYFKQPKALLIDFVIRYVKRLAPKWKFEKYYRYKDVLKIGANLPFTPVDVKGSDDAMLSYTGGTTGTPKGAIHTHRGLVSTAMQPIVWGANDIAFGKEVAAVPLPICIGAFTTYVFSMMYAGAHCILITNPLDVKAVVKELGRYKFTIIAAVNRYYNYLINAKEFTQLDFSKLKLPLTGGMAVQQSVFLNWEEITKTKLIENLCSTETNFTCMNPANPAFIGSAGLPLPSTEISIRNDRGEELGIDYPGELWIRGPQIMRGYWQQEALTNQVLTPDGWYKTGDIAMVNDQGYVRIIDRKKDVIYTYGYQVYPSEVEHVISIMPEVKEVAIVDFHDEYEGETVKAFIVKNDPALTKEKVIEFCKENLSFYKVPKEVEFRDELPKNTLGKVLRRALRQ